MWDGVQGYRDVLSCNREKRQPIYQPKTKISLYSHINTPHVGSILVKNTVVDILVNQRLISFHAHEIN